MEDVGFMNPAKIVAIVLLVSMMLHTGLQVNVAHLKTVLRDFGLLGRAFLANFVIVPLLGVLFARVVFHLSEPVATGILLMAICPGVPFVVLAGGRKKGGSLGFAVALAFLLPALSVITVPITARLVLPGSAISANSVILSLVLFQLVPLLIGMLVSSRAPEAAARLQRPLLIIVLVVVVVLLVVLGGPIARAIGTVYGSLGMLASACIVLSSLITGWLLGGREREYRRTLSVGTALRNIGLAALLATSVFGKGEVAAAVLTYLIIQIVLATLLGVFYTRTAPSPQ
jgi:predicted Na+-dependent transporter